MKKNSNNKNSNNNSRQNGVSNAHKKLTKEKTDATATSTIKKSLNENPTRGLSAEKILNYFSKSGVFSKAFADYEERPQQSQMVKRVVEAFNDDLFYLCEAPTGTGKSLSYLVPAVEWAQVNRQKVVISTNTINLQEQLFYKDIPDLMKALSLSDSLKVALVKGRSHYLCSRKFREMKQANAPQLLDEDLLLDGLNERELKEVMLWAEQTNTGDVADIPFIPHYTLWDGLASEVDTCKNHLCSHKQKCFYQKAKNNFFNADILIVNHHILCADMLLKKQKGSYNEPSLLPVYQKVIIDEAHHLEDVATSYFGKKSSRQSLTRTLNLAGKVQKKKISQQKLSAATAQVKYHLNGGVLLAVKNRFDKIKDVSKNDKARLHKIIQSYCHKASEVSALTNTTCKQLYRYLHSLKSSHSEGNKEIKIRIKPQASADAQENWHTHYVVPLQRWINAFEDIKSFFQQAMRLVQNHLQINAIVDGELPDNLADLEAYQKRLDEHLDIFQKTTESDTVGDEQMIIWITTTQQQTNFSLSVNIAPLNIQHAIKETIFDNLDTIILTSATLTSLNLTASNHAQHSQYSTNRRPKMDFDFYKNQTGLQLVVEDAEHSHRLHEDILSAVYNYQKQCAFFIPRDAPPPNSPQFVDKIAKYLLEAVDFFEGRTLTLFTSYQQMSQVRSLVASSLQQRGITLLVQGDGPRSKLLNAFKQNSRSTLLGVSSFWEGVDIKGDNLSCLIMPKLPFSVPTEPLTEARIEALTQQGRDAFTELSLPKAIIRFKQGFGRLIRSYDDKGLFVVLDNRILTKAYGKYFLNALPNLKQSDNYSLADAARLVML